MGRAGVKRLAGRMVLFLIMAGFLTAGIFLSAGKESLKGNGKLGLILEEHPDWEHDFAKLWKEEEKLVSENRSSYQETAKRIRQKYGYQDTVPAFTWQLAALFSAGMLCVFLIFWILEDKERKREQRKVVQELKEKEEELKRQAELFKERFDTEEQSTKELITNISHQLKTPLSSLKMSHELTISGQLTEEERKEFLYRETVEIEKLEQLTEELMKLSKLENHMIRLVPKMQPVNDAIRDAVSEIYGKAKGRNIEIEVEAEEALFVDHDRKWTAEALVNILDNAVKYSEEHTKIILRVLKLTTNVLIEIEDEGMGISTEEFHKIFKRFYRGDRAKAQVKEGAGVGLYLAQKIIEEEHGTIMAEKKESGQGSVFRILLPLGKVV